jgi:hypothetical protein
MTDEIVEHGVVEDLPPMAQVLRVAADADIRGADPLGSDQSRRLGVVGSDLEAVVNILGEGGTPR